MGNLNHGVFWLETQPIRRAALSHTHLMLTISPVEHAQTRTRVGIPDQDDQLYNLKNYHLISGPMMSL